MLLFVDKLTNSDFSYLHAQRGLLGETWLAHIELEGELDEQGMVCDFGIVKSTTRQLLDELIDHRLLVPSQAANLSLEHNDEMSQLRWQLDSGEVIEHRSPSQCVTLIDASEISPATVARWCEARLRERLPANVEGIRLNFHCEEIDGPFYHYSHGLKKHAGKCQRIAHGHRSKIQIQRNGQPAPELEAQWAERLRDSYIGTREDLRAQEDGYCDFAYSAPEGEFRLRLPERSCQLLDSDSTVEHIARHIAETLKAEQRDAQFTVRAYEGMGKGALVSR